jgi:hypothetical protein
MKALMSIGSIFAVLGATGAPSWDIGQFSLSEVPLLLLWGGVLLAIGHSIRQRPADAAQSAQPAARPAAPRPQPFGVRVEAVADRVRRASHAATDAPLHARS